MTGHALTRGSLLARNGLLNLIGQGVPLLVALIAIPMLIHGLGIDRFGVLTLAWMVIGYFSLFDLGLGRALSQLVSKNIGAGHEANNPPLIWTALALMLALGLLGTLVLCVISPWLVHSALKIPEPLQTETLNAFYLLAAAIPIVILTAGLAGILSALQRFGLLNAIRIPIGIYSFLAPLLILPFSQSLLFVTAALVLGRLVACGIHVAVCLKVMPMLRSHCVLQYSAVKPLFRFGAWMTVSSVVGPLMVYLDRFVIGAIVAVAAVAYYATPYEMVTKMWIVPNALIGVLFPAFAAIYRQDENRTAQLYVCGTKYIAIILFPAALMVSAFAHEGLQWWLGDEFALHSTQVLQWLVLGVFINSLAMVFITLIQGVGRPDWSAKLHFLELPIYIPTLWWAVNNYGIQGAAITWVGRVALDGVLLFFLSSRLLNGNPMLFKRMAMEILIAVVGLMIPMMVDGLVSRVITVFLIMVSFVFLAWFVVLTGYEREYIRGKLLGLIGGNV